MGFNSSYLGPRRVEMSSGSASRSLLEAEEVTPRFLERVFLLDEYRIPSSDRRSEFPEWFDEPSLPFFDEPHDSELESWASESSLK